MTPPFAALVRAHRRAAHLTLRELAGASGVSVRAISDMERGQSSAQPRTLDALADALNLGTSDRTALAAAADAARSAPSRALPRDVPDFTGRSAEVDLVTRCVRAGRPVVVHGPPGVGKTALAVHVATRSPGTVAFLDCRATTPAPPDAAERADRLRRAFGAAGPDLVVLDDVADEAQIPPVAGAVIVTSRRPLPWASGTRIPLAPLPADESTALLTTITGAAPDAAAAAVAEHCGHLPLALRIAGNRLAARPGWTMAHLADRLADEDRRLPTLSAGDLSVEAALASSYGRLSQPARTLCRELAAAPAHFDADAAAGLAGADVAAALAELVDAGLLAAPDPAGRYHVPALLRIFARSRHP